MVLENKTKKILKVLGLVLIILVLTGCARNLDENGNLIASRAITDATKWTWNAGWFDFFFIIPIAKGILFINNMLGNAAYGVIIVTIIINIITLPIMIKSTISTQKMQLLQPEIIKIQNKYRGRNDQASALRQNQEITKLYKKNDVSMWGSFATFLTLPIMIAMWQAVQRVEVIYSTNFLGINLGYHPMDRIMEVEIIYIVLVILVGASQFFAMKMPQLMAKRDPRYRESDQMKTMNTMNYMMTAMIVWFALTMPSAMSVYWIMTSIITIVRTYYIQVTHIEKVKKQVKDTNTNYLNKDK